MKLVKKSLIVASTVALGLTIAGCAKKSNLLKDVKPYGLEAETKQFSTKTLKGSFEQVRSYHFLGDRYVYYTTAQGVTTVYDFKAEKVIFTTEESIYTIYLYSDVILYIAYLDDTQEMRFIDGTVIYERKAYENIFAGNLEHKYQYKENNYDEIIAYTYNDEAGKDIDFTYYSIVFKGKKNENKKIVKDYDAMTITKLNADDVKKYHAGDKVIEDGSYYSYSRLGDNLVYYNIESNKPVLNLYIEGDYTSIISKDKALLQVQNDADEEGNYDVHAGNGYYNYDTYLLDLKNGRYKKLNNFNYFLKNSSSYSYTSNYFYFRNVGKVEGNEVICYNDITVSVKDGKIDDSQKYACSTEYTDLKNGYYLTSYNNKVFLTDKNGEIKKVFDGVATIYPKGKVIAIANNYKYRFIDFKGNYITDNSVTISYKYDVSLDTMFARTRDGKNHIITFKDGKIESDEEVIYNVQNSYVDFDDIRYNTYYVSKGNYYINATALDIDEYGTTTSCSVEFKQVGTDTLIGTIENITGWEYLDSISDNNNAARYIFAEGTVDSMTNSYTLSIYEFE